MSRIELQVQEQVFIFLLATKAGHLISKQTVSVFEVPYQVLQKAAQMEINKAHLALPIQKKMSKASLSPC